MRATLAINAAINSAINAATNHVIKAVLAAGRLLEQDRRRPTASGT
jgi:hypothetical protein